MVGGPLPLPEEVSVTCDRGEPQVFPPYLYSLDFSHVHSPPPSKNPECEAARR